MDLFYRQYNANPLIAFIASDRQRVRLYYLRCVQEYIRNIILVNKIRTLLICYFGNLLIEILQYRGDGIQRSSDVLQNDLYVHLIKLFNEDEQNSNFDYLNEVLTNDFSTEQIDYEFELISTETFHGFLTKFSKMYNKFWQNQNRKLQLLSDMYNTMFGHTFMDDTFKRLIVLEPPIVLPPLMRQSGSNQNQFQFYTNGLFVPFNVPSNQTEYNIFIENCNFLAILNNWIHRVNSQISHIEDINCRLLRQFEILKLYQTYLHSEQPIDDTNDTNFPNNEFYIWPEDMQKNYIHKYGGKLYVVAPYWKRAIAFLFDLPVIVLIALIIGQLMINLFDIEVSPNIMSVIREAKPQDEIIFGLILAAMEIERIIDSYLFIRIIVILTVSLFDAFWTYFITYRTYAATPGKMIMNIQILYMQAIVPIEFPTMDEISNGSQLLTKEKRCLIAPATPLTFKRAFFCAFAKYSIVTLSFPYIILILFWQHGRALHNLITKTIVVEANEEI